MLIYNLYSETPKQKSEIYVYGVVVRQVRIPQRYPAMHWEAMDSVKTYRITRHASGDFLVRYIFSQFIMSSKPFAG